MNKQRLPMNATCAAEVEQYIRTRAKQLRADGYVWTGIIDQVDTGIYMSKFERMNRLYTVIYKSTEANCSALPYFQLVGKVVTIDDCCITGYLNHNKIAHVVAAMHTTGTAYKAISKFYGDRCAERSGVFLMNHIDEGIIILNEIGASVEAVDAYCLHPIVQGDDDLKKNIDWVIEGQDAYTLMLAMEYRKTAMAYLSQHEMSKGGIQLSPLEEVNQMLIADKVQNRKDFEIYHKGTHPNSDRLTQYFNEWLAALGVSEDEYQYLVGICDGCN